MQKLISILAVLFIFFGCGKKTPTPDYNQTDKSDTLTINNIATDSTKILVAELPVYFDSTDYIIHQIGYVNSQEQSRKWIEKRSSYSDYASNDFFSSRSDDDVFSGNISNLIFENIKTNEQILLTKKVIAITDAEYLREIARKTNRQYILYSVIDQDLNKDNALNTADIVSLYISRADGTRFEKLTGKYHYYAGGKLIIQNLRYYFKTMEDINKDGNFLKTDKYHYYYIDFSTENYKVTEYDPFRLL